VVRWVEGGGSGNRGRIVDVVGIGEQFLPHAAHPARVAAAVGSLPPRTITRSITCKGLAPLERRAGKKGGLLAILVAVNPGGCP
jgi:hypothetical protein